MLCVAVCCRVTNVLQGVQHVLQRVATCCSVVACFLQVNLLCGVRCVLKSNYLRFSACEAGCGKLGLKLPQIGQRNFGKKVYYTSVCVWCTWSFLVCWLVGWCVWITHSAKRNLSVLQGVALCCNMLQWQDGWHVGHTNIQKKKYSALQCVAVCRSNV